MYVCHMWAIESFDSFWRFVAHRDHETSVTNVGMNEHSNTKSCSYNTAQELLTTYNLLLMCYVMDRVGLETRPLQSKQATSFF